MSHADHLLGLLNAAYRTHDHSRAGDTSIHVSDLIDFCPREVWLCHKHNRTYHPHKYHSMAEKYTFDLGHAIQKIQVHRLMSQQVIFGAWSCRHCNFVEYGMQQDRALCPSCKTKSWKYQDLGVEWKLQLNTKPRSQIIVRGNIDFVVAITPERGFIVDAKSIKAEDFDTLKAPSINYQRQVQLYMHYANKKGRVFIGRPRNGNSDLFHIDSKHGVLCYAVKGQRPAPYKPILVEQDHKFVEGIDRKLLSLKRSIERGVAPKKICTGQMSLMAKQCTIRDICFDQTV